MYEKLNGLKALTDIGLDLSIIKEPIYYLCELQNDVRLWVQEVAIKNIWYTDGVLRYVNLDIVADFAIIKKVYRYSYLNDLNGRRLYEGTLVLAQTYGSLVSELEAEEFVVFYQDGSWYIENKEIIYRLTHQLIMGRRIKAISHISHLTVLLEN